MLQELFTYATTRCPPYARRMGYLYEAIGMQARYGRNRAAWQPHCEKTRQFVLSCASRCNGRGTAYIIGSGILADVPLEELSALFREVVLIDVVFLPMACKKVKQCPNVRMLPLDVTGTAELVFQGSGNGMPSLPVIRPALPFPVNETDFVVSLNILSQLPVIPERYIVKTMRGIPGTQVDAWSGEIVSMHVKTLSALPCTVCLVSDFSYKKRDRKGTVIDTGDTLREVSLPSPDETWTWDIAPLGELSRRVSMELDVGAWHIR